MTEQPSAASPAGRALMIVVTYNSFEMVSDLTKTIEEFEHDEPRNFAIVVENSMDVRVRNVIEAGTDRARTMAIVSQENEGFSHGVNSGYRNARDLWGPFDYVVLLNPDVQDAGGAIKELVRRARLSSSKEVGIWGLVLKDEAGAIDRGCARRLWNRRRFFCHLVGLPNLARALGTKQRTLRADEFGSCNDLAMVSGAAMCITSEVMSTGLDTLLPMYLEDQEVCLRSLAGGRRVVLHPDLQLTHVGGASRKSLSERERPLKIMENVESPMQCMVRLQGYGERELRSIVLLAGPCRILAATASVLFGVALHPRRLGVKSSWLREQVRLSWWYITWAVHGRLHRSEVSLNAYFRSFERGMSSAAAIG